MGENDSVLEMKAGQFAVITMADGRLKAVRIVQVWEPGENVRYCGHDKGPASCRMVSLEKLCLSWASSVLRVLDTELEARVFGLERELEEVRAELLREREASARSRDKLRKVREALVSLGTV